MPHNPEALITLTAADGLPDGLTVDADGYLWIAMWGGSQVRRYDPVGRLAGRILLPTPNVSSCTFGGPEMRDLFITTAAADVAPDDSGWEYAGSLFMVPAVGRGQVRKAFCGPIQ